MRRRDIPAARGRCFVFVTTKSYHILHSLLQVGPIHRLSRFRINRDGTRRIKDGIATKNKKLLDPPGGDITGKLKNAVVARVPLKLPDKNRVADILEGRIDSVGQQLNHHWLIRAGQDETCSWF